jgi:hypothetical protein
MSVSDFVLEYPQIWSSFDYLISLTAPPTLMSAHMSVSKGFSLTLLVSVSCKPLILTRRDPSRLHFDPTQPDPTRPDPTRVGHCWVESLEII